LSTLGSNFLRHLFDVLNRMSITNYLWFGTHSLCGMTLTLKTVLLTGPVAYVIIWDSCFMNKALQMTKFSPSANCKIWNHLLSCLHTQNHHVSHHSQHYYFQHAHSYHQLTQPFHSEVYNSPKGTFYSKNSLFPPAKSNTKCTRRRSESAYIRQVNFVRNNGP